MPSAWDTKTLPLTSRATAVEVSGARQPQVSEDAVSSGAPAPKEVSAIKQKTVDFLI
jgi:hypothetical protein